MQLKRCNFGHFYDADKYNICPYCFVDLQKAEQEKMNTHIRIIIKRIGKNIYRWLIQTVILSLIPLFLYMLLHWMFKVKEDATCRYISEICTFTLVISSSVTLELTDKKYNNSSIREIIFPAYLVLLIIFLVIYGIILFCFELGIPLKEEILNKMFWTMGIISLIHFVIGILLQIIGEFYAD